MAPMMIPVLPLEPPSSDNVVVHVGDGVDSDVDDSNSMEDEVPVSSFGS